MVPIQARHVARRCELNLEADLVAGDGLLTDAAVGSGPGPLPGVIGLSARQRPALETPAGYSAQSSILEHDWLFPTHPDHWTVVPARGRTKPDAKGRDARNVYPGDPVEGTTKIPRSGQGPSGARGGGSVGSGGAIQRLFPFASLLIQQGESLAYVRDQMGYHSIRLASDPELLLGSGCRASRRTLGRPVPVATRRTPILAGRTNPESGDAQDALSPVPARASPAGEVCEVDEMRGARVTR